jgi:hypothetical protein
MNWIIFIIGMSLSVALRLFTTDQVFNFYPSILTAFATGLLFMGMEAKRKASKDTSRVDPKMITLRRMAIRLSYLSREGTLSKCGNHVLFEAEGPDTANEFMDAIMAVVEAAE